MKCPKSPKIIMVPYPAQGHVTPMLQLASAFLRLGFSPIVVVPEFIHRKIVPKISDNKSLCGESDYDRTISCLSIPDGLDDDSPRDFFAIEMAMEKYMPDHLERIVCRLMQEEGGDCGGGGGGLVCMVVDLLASWAIKVGNGCGVPVAGFWPVMLAAYRLIAAIPTMLRTGIISHTGSPQFKSPIHVVPGQPMLNPEDLPWLIGTSAARVSRFKFWTRTLDRTTTLRWLLVNSSHRDECLDYEQQKQQHFPHVSDHQHSPSIFQVGPLSKHVPFNKKATIWEEDMTCLDWLDQQHASSVVYVSFGSWVSPIGEGKVQSLALALEASGLKFIWVLGPSWRDGLPDGYMDRVSKQGRLVSWAPQMDVLRHEAVGCYLTHCGWNSTMEAIQCKKPLVCYPVAGDQFVNCAYIVKVWQIGVRIRGFGQKDVQEGLSRVMEDTMIKHSLVRLNERIMGKEASSCANAHLTAFLNDLHTSRTGN
ncbi:UDP-glycosyltransferase 82A1 [Actinidia eriantha]|uniref:UDP-glycosyltransferase 82A1 n=1 Tax=Actinidia eriantha TaxID=165200 RepID=UPI002582FB05|nr:UDP-glycosyltransferase 82A1 [Actinidia eriantha]